VNGAAARGASELQIRHRFSEARFVASVPNQMTKLPSAPGFVFDIKISVVPGRITSTEQMHATNENELLAEIGRWLQRLHEEQNATPIARRVAGVEQLIQDLYKKTGLDAEDAPLEAAQAESMIAWIRRLESQLAESIEARKLGERELRARLESLHTQVGALVTVVGSTITKRGAVRAVFGRVFKWTSDESHRRLLAEAGTTIAGFLGDGAARS